MTSHEYDEDYFEKGVEKRISGYTDYRWRPEYVLPMANWLKQRFGDVKYLDFGCAKGFLVKALRLLGCEAYGYDVSTYAIENAELEVKDFVETSMNALYISSNVIIAKDVLEHIPKEEIVDVVGEWEAKHIVVVVPLGDNGKFRIREYEMDVTHVTKEDEVWWIKQFNEAGFKVDEFHYTLPGIKDNWAKEHPYGNGIFILKK